MKESTIQRGILDYLETVPGAYGFRAGSGSFRLASGRYMRTGRPGVPDIVLCLLCHVRNDIIGVWVGLEVKNEKGRQSKTQKQAEETIKSSGGEYYVVRSISEAKKAIKEIREKMSDL